ncbi:transporter [Paucibacter sp. R3-3]|uniref:Transporter n=1 Tax=Roseateles agri TaxID=3098619 RepID=A0ABU5DJZ5_9BURK|nr:transporter [Paucibacter sp. R3-3]MDY0746101.1 transporter [Paucibacter sp. R3-3]
MFRTLTAALILSAVAAAAHADDDAISPDRPNIANSPDVVGRGTAQIETGLAGTSDSGAHALGLPWLLRVGLSDTLELRLDSGGYQRVRQDGVTVKGWNDVGLGFKWHLTDGGGAMPGIGLLGHLSFASGSTDLRGQGTRPEVDLALHWELGAGYDLSVMPGIYQDRNDAGQRYTGGVLAASIGKDLSEDTNAFLEVAGQRLASARNGGRLVTLDTGVTHRLSKDMQVDAALFRGLDRESPDWQWTVGLSLRW